MPTSKVIQISATATERVFITALCEDGSIWLYRAASSSWVCVLESPLK